ncbi:hypothetical protein KY495_20990 [Massilia sp. PAMC28688]|uniref:beta/gamma crystallin domain-containing protein n=1 Tax=Massilia sp. PAMC28688 TaxID=2861283 RepID=UPI001C639527|nr:beta/gamma crystallin domain-containing protein [Massilia sp. PAMC28688]QYF93139.1 hypothetical protein KY495_20990 [Massilia sp. PAMC28688]
MSLLAAALMALAIQPHAVGAGQDSATKAQTAQTSTAKAAGTQSTKGAPAPIVSLVLVPIVPVAQDPITKGGCWARLHDGQSFSGDALTVAGPLDMPTLVGPFGIDWKGKISSVETGPKATLMVYDNENYHQLVSTFKPGVRIADVSKRLGFFDQMRSLKITCTK